MSLTLTNAVRSAMADAAVDLLDAGSGAGKIRIYDGSRPAGPSTAVSTQTLLAEITCSDPAFGSAANGVATVSGTPLSVAAAATGTASWFRALDSNNLACIDGTVTATGGGGDLTIASVSVVSATTVRITGGNFTQPAS